METSSSKIKESILCNNERDINLLLVTGLDPNYEGGWPVRLAARTGRSSMVRAFVQHGANPTLLGESGASTLQLAVYSGKHWDTDKWSFLLSYCDSSQLADAAAVAIIFNNIAALKRILQTGRCNTNIPTTLTGRTVESLAKGYKLHHLLNNSASEAGPAFVTPTCSPRVSRQSGSGTSLNVTPQPQRNLSPSVAQFFNQTASQPSLTPPPQQRLAFTPTSLLQQRSQRIGL